MDKNRAIPPVQTPFWIKLLRFFPAPTLVGLILSIIAVSVAWMFSLNTTVIFLLLIAISWFLLFISQYKLLFENQLILIGLALIGHIPYLVAQLTLTLVN